MTWFDFFLHRLSPVIILYFYNSHRNPRKKIRVVSNIGREHAAQWFFDLPTISFLFHFHTGYLKQVTLSRDPSKPYSSSLHQCSCLLCFWHGVTCWECKGENICFRFQSAHIYGGHGFKWTLLLEAGREAKGISIEGFEIFYEAVQIQELNNNNNVQIVKVYGKGYTEPHILERVMGW